MLLSIQTQLYLAVKVSLRVAPEKMFKKLLFSIGFIYSIIEYNIHVSHVIKVWGGGGSLTLQAYFPKQQLIIIATINSTTQKYNFTCTSMCLNDL